MKRILSILLLIGLNLLRLNPGTVPAAAVQAQTPRVVSLSPSITYTLQQMGLDDAVCGRTSYCPAPLDGHKSTVIGNVLEINLEQILKLKPDFVFAMSFTKPETLEKLRKAGIQVKNFHTPASFEEICEQTVVMGRLTGCGEEAQKWTDSMAMRVRRLSEHARKVAANRPRLRVFFQIGDNPVFPVIEGTYMNQYLTLLGLDNVVKNYKGGGISKEYVIAAKPDVMLISVMGGNGEAVMKQWQRYTAIPAVANHRMTLVNDDKACCPTPLFFAETLEAIYRYVYGR